MKRFSTTSERNGYKLNTVKGDYSESFRNMTDFHKETGVEITDDVSKIDDKTEFANAPIRNGYNQNIGEMDFSRRYSYMRKFNGEKSLDLDKVSSKYLQKGEEKLEYTTNLEKNGFIHSHRKSIHDTKFYSRSNFEEDTSLASDEDIPEELPNFDERAECSIETNFDSPEKEGNTEITCTPQIETPRNCEKDSLSGMKIDIKNIKQENAICPGKEFQIKETEFAISNEKNASVLGTKFDGNQHAKSDCENINSEFKLPLRQRQTLSVLTIVNRQRFISPEKETISPTSDIKEPRVALKKLKQQLDQNNQEAEIENFRNDNENIEEKNDEVLIIKDTKLEEQIKKYEIPEVIDVEYEESNATENGVEVMQQLKSGTDIKEETENCTINKVLAERNRKKLKKHEENIEKRSNNCSKKKRKGCFHFKKEESKNSKSKRCQIM